MGERVAANLVAPWLSGMCSHIIPPLLEILEDFDAFAQAAHDCPNDVKSGLNYAAAETAGAMSFFR